MPLINEKNFREVAEKLTKRMIFSDAISLWHPEISLRDKARGEGPRCEGIDLAHLGFDFSSQYRSLKLTTKLEEGIYLVGFMLKYGRNDAREIGGSFELKPGENPEVHIGGKAELRIPMGKPAEGLVLYIQDYHLV